MDSAGAWVGWLAAIAAVVAQCGWRGAAGAGSPSDWLPPGSARLGAPAPTEREP